MSLHLWNAKQVELSCKTQFYVMRKHKQPLEQSFHLFVFRVFLFLNNSIPNEKELLSS